MFWYSALAAKSFGISKKGLASKLGIISHDTQISIINIDHCSSYYKEINDIHKCF